MLFKPKEKWHDGYYVEDNDIVFYKDPILSKVTEGAKVYIKNSEGELKTLFPKKLVQKVSQDKIVEYEGICRVYRENFGDTGMLRLHTPIGIHQEHLGVEFLFVPVKHRERIKQMIGDGYLIMLDSIRLFRIFPTDITITIEELIGSGVISDPEQETDYPIQLDNPEENRFFIRQFQIVDMFIYYESKDK
ncbi:MAG: hypothetical protein JXA17_04285 [Dehalococcoidales bacterium]|nr:hypothetical protein [Dehalococcoidales bacterium]